MLAKLGNYTFDGTTLEASLIMFVPVIRFNVFVPNVISEFLMSFQNYLRFQTHLETSFQDL